MRRCFLALSAVLAVGITAVALAATNATVTSDEPQPGGTVTAGTQPIGTSQKVQLVVTGGLGKTTLVAEGGVRKSTAQGDAVAACWLAGPGAIPVTNARVKRILETDPDIQESFDGASKNAQLTLALCLDLVRAVGENLAKPGRRAVAAATGCDARPLNLRFKRRNGTTVVTLAKTGRPRTRYGCTKVKGGFKLTARGRGAPLSREVGPSIGLGVYKAPDGPPSSGKLTFRFGLR